MTWLFLDFGLYERIFAETSSLLGSWAEVFIKLLSIGGATIPAPIV